MSLEALITRKKGTQNPSKPLKVSKGVDACTRAFLSGYQGHKYGIGAPAVEGGDRLSEVCYDG